jgi:hypothetical protein
MSRRANCSAPRLLRLYRHRTPFVLCWGEGASLSSQHASRRVLRFAKEDGYIPGWGRKMVVVMLLWQQDQHSRHSLLHSATQRAPQRATQRPTQRVTQREEACSRRRLSIVRTINHMVSCWCVWRSIAWRNKMY